MPSNSNSNKDKKREELVQNYSAAARRAHDKGNQAAAGGLAAALQLMTKNEK